MESSTRVSQFIVGEDPRHLGGTGERLDDLFEEIARRNGPSPAVVCEGRIWSYAEIDGRANQLARLLIERGVKPGERVGLLLNRSADTYVAMLAVMKARAVYVPLAVTFPEQRITFIIEDAGLGHLRLWFSDHNIQMPDAGSKASAEKPRSGPKG